MHACLDHGEGRLLTRNGLNWIYKYPQIVPAGNIAPRAPSLPQTVRRARRRHHV
jgi:hypothetical protein